MAKTKSKIGTKISTETKLLLSAVMLLSALGFIRFANMAVNMGNNIYKPQIVRSNNITKHNNEIAQKELKRRVEITKCRTDKECIKEGKICKKERGQRFGSCSLPELVELPPSFPEDDFDNDTNPLDQLTHYNMDFGQAQPGDPNIDDRFCAPLTQTVVDAYLDEIGNNPATVADIIAGGCLELEEDINMGIGALSFDDYNSGLEFNCNGYEIIGTGAFGMFLNGTVTANDCVISDRTYNSDITGSGRGLMLYDTSTVNNSTADNNYYGFELHDTSTVNNSTAINSEFFGFRLFNFSTVDNSTADNNYHGFGLNDTSVVNNSTAHNNSEGFILSDNSTVNNSTAYDNDLGLNSGPWGEPVNIIGGSFCNNTNNDIESGNNAAIFTGIIQVTDPVISIGTFDPLNSDFTLETCTSTTPGI